MITESVIARLTDDTKELFDFYDKKGLYKTKKQKSEDISGLLENAMASLIDGAVAPKIDAEPDIRLHGEPVEIRPHRERLGLVGHTLNERATLYSFIGC
jgi:hypothetical protein